MCVTLEEAAQAALFLYEPALIGHIAELLLPSHGAPDQVVAAAVLALETCAHYSSKFSEVLTAVSPNVNHGILITLFRFVVSKLDGTGKPGFVGPCLWLDTVSDELVDAIFSFIAFITASPPHGHMLVSAGILPVLLEMAQTHAERRNSVSLCCQVSLITSTFLVQLVSLTPWCHQILKPYQFSTILMASMC